MDCPLSAAIRSGLFDDVMFRMFDDMAKLPFPVEETEAYFRERRERDNCRKAAERARR